MKRIARFFIIKLLISLPKVMTFLNRQLISMGFEDELDRTLYKGLMHGEYRCDQTKVKRAQ